jgi:hypothetical protein
MKKVICFYAILIGIACNKQESNSNDELPVVNQYCIIKSDTFYSQSKCPYTLTNSLLGRFRLIEIINTDSCNSIEVIKKTWWINNYEIDFLGRDTMLITGKKANSKIFLVNNSLYGFTSELNNDFAIEFIQTTDLMDDEYDKLVISTLKAKSKSYSKNQFIYKYNNNIILKFQKI